MTRRTPKPASQRPTGSGPDRPQGRGVGRGVLALAGAALLPLCLAACQPAENPRAHLFENTRATSTDVPVGFRTAGPVDLTLAGSDGAALPTRLWRAAGPEHAVILALHGFNDSRDGWELSAPVFAASGVTVYAPDQRGFGAAPGRGGWPGTDTLIADARALVAAIAAREPGAPIYVLGESMGGAEVQILAADPPPGVTGFIALAPAVWTARQMGPGKTIPLALANTFAPDWQPKPGTFGIHRVVSDNCTALLRLSYDPLTLPSTRIDTLHGLVGLMDRAAAAAPHVRAPLLVGYGAHDGLVPAASIRAEWAALPQGVRRAYYPNGYHLLPDDLNRQAVISDVLAWIADPGGWLPSGADIYAGTFDNFSSANEASPPLWGRLDSLAGGADHAHTEKCRFDAATASELYPQLVARP